MRKTTLSFALMGTLMTFNISANEVTTEGAIQDGTPEYTQNSIPAESTGKTDTGSFIFPNPFDPSTWKDDSEELKPGITVAIQPLNPAFWSNFANPKMHSKMHMAFTNPQQYMQFMTPQFYAQFMNPANYMAMMNPQSYTMFMDPNTWMYWMQPGAYTHGLNPNAYMQMMNPAAYMSAINPELMSQWMNASTSFAMAPGFANPQFDAAANQ